jgi:hypothetical protein
VCVEQIARHRGENPVRVSGPAHPEIADGKRQRRLDEGVVVAGDALDERVVCQCLVEPPLLDARAQALRERGQCRGEVSFHGDGLRHQVFGNLVFVAQLLGARGVPEESGPHAWIGGGVGGAEIDELRIAVPLGSEVTASERELKLVDP